MFDSSAVVPCDIVHTCFRTKKRPNSTDLFHHFHLEANMIPTRFLFFRPLWRRTRLGEVGDLCKLHNNWSVKFGMIRHFASYRLVIGHSHGKLLWKMDAYYILACSHSQPFILSTKRRSVEIHVCSLLFCILHNYKVILSRTVLRMCSSLISELKGPLLLWWVRVWFEFSVWIYL